MRAFEFNTRLTRVVAAALIATLAACGGGGGGGGGGPGVPGGRGNASGVVIVPPNNKLEAEPNNGIGQVQDVAPGDALSGEAAFGDTGFSTVDNVRTTPATVTIHDVYRITVTQPARVVLTVGADDLTRNDLDLFLMDTSGNVGASSFDTFDTEVVEIPTAGTYLVGVQAFNGSSSYLIAFATQTSPSATADSAVPVGAEFVSGEVLVQMQPGKAAARDAMRALGAQFEQIDTLSNGVARMRVAARATTLSADAKASKQDAMSPANRRNSELAATLSALRRLRSDPAVAYAEPNYIYKALRVPNDEFFPLQWHYRAINLPQAWDISVGTESVVTVAVIDTGVSSTHPDLSARLVPGYDLISNPTIALDGDGRDSNPEDPGDDRRRTNSSFHGTHVAGTIGAQTDNSIGVAGVSWGARIMPLRVLGDKARGGDSFDIAEAILYAAGLSSIRPAGSRLADVVNMSLGGSDRSQAIADAVDAARTRGVILVAAAGNKNTSEPLYPAALPGVVSVSAVDFGLNKAAYSSFGTTIDVAAPGGDTDVDLNDDAHLDGVLSTMNNDANVLRYKFEQGTSMAAPHVAGVIALMRSVHPRLTPNDVDLLLAGTHPSFSARITTDLGAPGRDNVFGHGLIDAARAVAAASQLATFTPPTGSALALSGSTLDFQSFVRRITVAATNAGGGALSVSLVSADQPWLKVTPTSGTAPLELQISVDRTGLAAGAYTGTITVTSNANLGPSSATINVRMQVLASGASGGGDVGEVFVLAIDPATGESVADVSATKANGYTFNFPSLPVGQYQFTAGTDRDLDDLVCDFEDACGAAPDTFAIAKDSTTVNIDIVVSNYSTQPQAARKAAAAAGAAKRVKP